MYTAPSSGFTKEAYLQRIRFRGTIKPDLTTLIDLHESHVYAVPFENLDVQNKVLIQLELGHLFNKVVNRRRGGFCYELNYLFYELLREIGFEVNMISASTYEDGTFGPAFDHLALVIHLDDQLWLADVGYGDLFVRPLPIDTSKTHFDGRHHFRFEQQNSGAFILSMSSDQVSFSKKYLLKLDACNITDFHAQCEFKQHHPASYFVRNRVVTLPTMGGRKTIFNGKLIINERGERMETPIRGEAHLWELVRMAFGMEV